VYKRQHSSRDDNSYHVITYHYTDPNTILDGFVIMAGEANLDNVHDEGGGMYGIDGNPVISNCFFTHNAAKNVGGGIYDFSGKPILTNCTFTGNFAVMGGGMCNLFGEANLTNCRFSGNWATRDGGGMGNDYSEPNLTNCMFEENVSTDDGGAISNLSYSFLTLKNCNFSGNTSRDAGGGLFNRQSYLIMTDCIFSGNSSTEAGAAAIYISEWSNVTLTNCTIIGNTAATHSGGVSISQSDLTITNSIISCNSAGQSVGGMGIYYDSSTTVSNCTISRNSAGQYGGGMLINDSSATVSNCTFASNTASNGKALACNSASPSTVELANCIFWDEGGEQNEIYNLDGSTITIGYSDVRGGLPAVYDPYEGVVWGSGNIDADPLFERYPSDGGDGWGDDPGTPGIDEGENDDYGDLHLLAGSPCIDAGDSNAVPEDIIDLDGDGDTIEPIPWDLDGHPRFYDDPNTADTGTSPPPTVDMGAYEFGGICGDIDHPYPVGDVNIDCVVDLVDFAICALAWLTEDGQAGWNPDCNLYDDFVIDTSDLRILGAHWLECTKPECD